MHVICFRQFDIGEGIDLERARALVGRRPADPVRLDRPGAAFVQLESPPLRLELGARTLALPGGEVPVSARASLFHFGAISVQVRVELPAVERLEALLPHVLPLHESAQVDALARALLAELRQELQGAVKDPHLWPSWETYTVVVARPGECGPLEAALGDPALARLLVGEAGPLSEQEASEVLSRTLRYSPSDAATIDWNGAFLVEPQGSEDVVDLLEVANAQLLELRYYDAVLDEELARVHRAMAVRSGANLLASPYRGLMRGLMQRIIELSALVERVENALKIVGDAYLARVFQEAARQLRVPQWAAQVTRKQGLLLQAYQLLKGEVDTARALTLEAMVVLLIVLEILLALAQVTGH